MHRCNKGMTLDTASGEAYASGWSRTIVARPVAIGLSVLFCSGLLVVPIADGFLGAWREPLLKGKEGITKIVDSLSKGDGSLSSLMDANNTALQTITSFESSLEDSSELAAGIRPLSLDALLRLGGAGSEEAYIGRDGWIFYRPDVDAIVMQPHAAKPVVQGIVDFAAQLANRGIRLVLVPVPGKATIHPEKLGAGNAVFQNPVNAPVLWDLATQVREVWSREKIADEDFAPIVHDATRQMWQRKVETGEDQFLETDSHWTHGAMTAIAQSVAEEILAAGISIDRERLGAETKEVSSIGDTALMLELPAASPLRKPQSVTVEQVKMPDGSLWRANRSSPVLVLGDSYSNIYSADALGWGGAAGFAEQLSLQLNHLVDKLARNDAGAKSAREMLATEALRNPHWFDGKKVVVWVMAAREFVRGDWSAAELPASREDSEKRKFLVVSAGESPEVTARLLSVGALPEPGESPYADYLTALHLGEIQDEATGRIIPGEALAYVFTMRDRKIVSLPGLVEGKRVKLRLSNYAERAGKLDSLNRGDLEDFGVMMEEPNFAEWIAP